MSNKYAFPTGIGAPGMTLRQWYKGQILVGLCADLRNFQSNERQLMAYAGKLADEAIAEDIAFDQAQAYVYTPPTSVSR